MSGKIIKSARKPVTRKSGLSVTAQKVSVAPTKMLAANHNENLALKSPRAKESGYKGAGRKNDPGLDKEAVIESQ